MREISGIASMPIREKGVVWDTKSAHDSMGIKSWRALDLDTISYLFGLHPMKGILTVSQNEDNPLFGWIIPYIPYDTYRE